MPDIWTMVRCLNCQSLFLDPRPDDRSLPRAYDDYYTHHADMEVVPEEGARGLLWRLINGYLNYRFGMHRSPASRLGYPVFLLLEPLRLKLDYFGRHLTCRRFPRPGRLLDIGCGNGAFLARARDMGWTVSGCEPDRKAVEVCRSLGLDVLVGDAFNSEFDSRRFDVITMSHVIEHVSDPIALFRRAHELLNPGGKLWLALPNPNSFSLKAFGQAWKGLHVPFHLCIPSQARLHRWSECAGFEQSRCVRRGVHVRSNWIESISIEKRERQRPQSVAVRAIERIFTDLVSVFSPRWADETVFIAYKPAIDNA